MSLLYKDPKDVITSVRITKKDKDIGFWFTADCGKHGTEEGLDEFTLTPERLLQILQEREDLTDDEN